MSELALGAALTAGVKGEAETGARVAATTSPCITGRIYQIVPTTGLDGKNLLKLLPVSKPIGNCIPLHQSPVVSDNMKANVAMPGHSNLQDLFGNTTTFPCVKNPELKKATPGKLILPKLLGQVEKVDAFVIKENLTIPVISSIIKENPTTVTVSSIQNNYHSVDRSGLQNDAAPACSGKNNAGYVLVNANSLSVAPKSQVCPSRHPLQVPPHAEVKSSASLLPASIQQKILATAASNASTKAPTVIYLSPVNTVQPAPSKVLQNISPKPVTILTVPQTAVSSSAPSDSKTEQASPIKWVVQESPESSTSCLVPVTSSHNMASNILNTLGNVKIIDNNPASISPAIFNNLSESQTEISSMKDNTLVMYNGKMYLLTKKEPSAVSEIKFTKQILPSDEAHRKRHKSHLISSPADSTITNQVVSLVLSKSKGVACNPNDPKSSENMRQLPSELNKSLKVASTSLMSPHGNLQIDSTSKHEATPVLGNILPGMNVDQKPVTRENTTQNFIRTVLFHKPAASTLLPSKMPDTFKEEKEKIEIIPGIRIQHRKEQDRKQCSELRKKFGLFKEERVYLRRVPIPVTPIRLETTVCSGNVQISDSCDFSQRVPVKSELQEEEKIIEKPEEKLNIKRKTKTPPMSQHVKRKKTMVNPDAEQNDLYSAVNNQNSHCRQLESQKDNSQGFLQFSQRVDLDSNPCIQSNEKISTSGPASDCNENETSHNETSFREDIFSFSLPDLEDTIKDEKITRLKLLLREQEAALEEIRKKMQQT